MADWKKAIFELSDVRILLYLGEKGKARYSELLSKVVKNRSTLASSLADLQDMGLLNRQVKNTRPVQTEYLLTEKGNQLTGLLVKVNEMLASKSAGAST
jgi:DNA-binding HxlR family transcriptional regulator